MIYGTHHFRSLAAAATYYRDQGHADGYAAAREKLAAGEIALGAPTARPGQRVLVNREGRYVIEEG